MEEDSKSRIISDHVTKLMASNTQPKEFFNWKKTSIPSTKDEAMCRIQINLDKFKTYYTIIVGISVLAFLLYQPWFLFIVGIVMLNIYGNMYTPTIYEYTFTNSIVNWTTGGLFLVCIIWLHSVIIHALALVSFMMVAVFTHAATIEEEEVPEEV